MKSSSVEAHVLMAIRDGAALKVHRTVDGRKTCVLHGLDGTDQTIPMPVVDALKSKGLIQSNLKFPAATYLLTDAGLRQAEDLLSSGREHNT